MNKCIVIGIVVLNLIVGGLSAQSSDGASKNSNMMVFNEFKMKLRKLVKNENYDTSLIDDITGKYTFHFQYDSGNINFKQNATAILRSEITNLAQYFNERNFDSITALPISLFVDKSVYQRLSDFQKNNTLVIFNIANPSVPYMYMLFIPANISKSDAPKIVSWKLIFSYGIYLFMDLIGNEGLEVLFDGVQAPKKPISL